MLRESADVNLQGVGPAAHSAQQVAGENRGQSGRKAAVGRDAYSALGCFLVERKFLAHDPVVAAQVGKVAPGLDSGFGQRVIAEVRHRGERRLVTLHQLAYRTLVRRVDFGKGDLPASGEAVDLGSRFLGAPLVNVGKRDCLHRGRAGHVVSCRRSHHSGTNHE